VERKYSSYSFSTAALDEGEWSTSRPGRALAPVKGPTVPIVQETGWAPEPVWTQKLEEKSFASAGFSYFENFLSSCPKVCIGNEFYHVLVY
jgi:hypothetical protein